MKYFTCKLCAILFIVFSIQTANAQQTFINEGFEQGMPEGWTVYNEDGDQNEWAVISSTFWSMTGEKAVGLQATQNSNDWLVTPQIYLQDDYILSFWATEILEGADENLSVWLSTTGNTPADFTINLSNITVPYLGYDDNGYLYTSYKIDLTDYQGENVYIAWQLTPTAAEVGFCLIDNITTEYTAENLEWSLVDEDYFTNSVATLTNGGFITAGSYDGNVQIQRLNNSGVELWDKQTIGSVDGSSAHSVIQTLDNQDNPSGYAITGEKNMPGNFNLLIWICKYDTIGNLEWTRDYGINDDQNEGNSIKQTNDGGYIITGYQSLSAQIILIKLDENGDEQWVKTYGDSDLDFANDVVQTADGGFAVTGYYKKYNGAIGTVYLLKTDKDGNEEFWSEYPDTEFARADGISQTSDGGFILCAFKNANGRDWRIIKTDNIGETEWEYTTGGPQEDVPYSVIQTVEGNYLVAGFKTVNDNQKMYIVKINQTGNLIWETEYETETGQSRIEQIQQTHDGGYVFTGPTTAFSDLAGFTAKINPDETEISQNDIISFYLPEQTEEPEIDNVNHTVTVTVDEQTIISALAPVIITTPQSRLFPRSATTHDFSGNYIYTVTALDQTRQQWTVIVEGGTTGINKIDNHFSIYPNPSNGVFNVDLQIVAKPYSINIIDVTGKTIYTSTVQQGSNTFKSSIINLKDRPAGIYFIKIKTETEIYTEKIIIQK